MKLDLFDRFLKLIGRDYWQLEKGDLYRLAVKYKLEGVKHTLFDREELDPFEGMFEDKSFLDEIKLDRSRIIDQLEARDKFASSFVAIVISVLALAISILVAVFK